MIKPHRGTENDVPQASIAPAKASLDDPNISYRRSLTTDLTQRSLLQSAARKLWNNLPTFVYSLDIFRTHLKTHLFKLSNWILNSSCSRKRTPFVMGAQFLVHKLSQFSLCCLFQSCMWHSYSCRLAGRHQSAPFQHCQAEETVSSESSGGVHIVS